MKNILIVDDQERIRRAFSRILQGAGFKVMEAAGAVAAYDILNRNPIDLVLLDIKMPEVPGDILNDVAGIFHRNVKIVVCSVYPVDEQRLLVKGADDYFDKSDGPNALLKKVKEVLWTVKS